MLHARSMALIDEAKSVTRDKDTGSIEAPGSMKDDRVVAAALATHCWEERIKKDMLAHVSSVFPDDGETKAQEKSEHAKGMEPGDGQHK